jgi:hypothetical protein
MKIGDWEIDDRGVITHLKCNYSAIWWSPRHMCRELATGRHIITPEFVHLIAKIQYDIMYASREASRESRRGKA